jgi:chitinase
VTFTLFPSARPVHRGRLHWVTGYWRNPVNEQSLPVADIGYSALTHIVHYSLNPNADGSFEAHSLAAVTKYAAELVFTAHRHGVKVLLGVTQTTYGGDYAGATRDKVMPVFLANILQIVNRYGYDGVDIDWEPQIEPGRLIAFVCALRKELDAQSRPLELTGAFWEAPWYLVKVKSAFDQINIMSYDNCAPSDGFSWHNAALYNEGNPWRRTVDWRVRKFLSVIPREKLGLGIPFYGYVWSGGRGTTTGGVTRPGQHWTSAPVMRSLDFREIVSSHALWLASYRRRDQAAGDVPFLSIDQPDPANDKFVTYDDPLSVSRKVAYARAQSLGGIMIYELSGDYLPNRTRRHPLLDAIAIDATPAGDLSPRSSATLR